MIIQNLEASQRDLDLLKQNSSMVDITTIDFKNITVTKPWGEEYLLFENPDVAIWILKIDQGKETSFHAHPNKTTSLIVLNSTAQCKTLTNNYKLNERDAILLGKKVFHQTSNCSTQALYIMEIESPVDKFDLVRYQDSYGRQGTAYESKNSFTPRPNSYKNLGHTKLGSSHVIINFASTMKEFLSQVSHLSHAVVTILDRHIWSNKGDKLIEVGSSFKLENLSQEFYINDHFHYVIIHQDIHKETN